MAVALHAAADEGAVENVQCRKQGGGAVALIVVGDGGAAAGLERQPGLGSIEGLDLRLLVDRQHHGMGRRVHVEADDVFDLLGEGGIVGAFESTDAMRLQVAGSPNALHRAQADADGLGHGPAGPMGGLAGRLLLTGHGDHSSDRLRRQRRPSRRPGLVAQQALDAFLGKPALPAPHRRPAHAGQTRHLCHRQALGRRHRMIRTRCTCLSGRERSPTIAAKRARSSAPTMTLSSCAITRE